MKIVIIENELYLAQSIAAKLQEAGHTVVIYSSIKEAIKGSNGDVYLLSTTLPGQNCTPLITKFKEKIIILMVNYINNDTVGIPLQQGANDYILKPFMIEELRRKIDHYQEYKNLKEQNRLFLDYTENLLKDITVNLQIEKIQTPIAFLTNYSKLVDKIVFSYASLHRKHITFISLADKEWREKIASSAEDSLLYLSELQTLKKGEREQLFEYLKGYDFILSTTSEIEMPYDVIKLKSENRLYDEDEILTVDDYVKYIVNSFQSKYPDTELSKKLGISRKSLWEKRKKYGIFKQK